MSYWIIETVPGRGVYVTADTRTTSDFNDGNGKVICDGANKLFVCNPDGGNLKFAICFAGSALLRTGEGNIAVSDIFQGFVDRVPIVPQYANFQTAAEVFELFAEYYLRAGLKVFKEMVFNDEDGNTKSMRDVVLSECAIGIAAVYIPPANTEGAADLKPIVSAYVHNVLSKNGNVISHASNGDFAQLCSNGPQYCDNDPDRLPFPKAILPRHLDMVKKAVDTNPSLANAVSDECDQVFLSATVTFEDETNIRDGKVSIYEPGNYKPIDTSASTSGLSTSSTS